MAQIVVSSKPAVAVPRLTALTRMSCELSSHADRLKAALGRIARGEGAPVFEAKGLRASMNESGVGNAVEAMAFGWERGAAQWLAWASGVAKPAMAGVFLPSLPPSIQAKRSDPALGLLIHAFDDLSASAKALRQAAADIANGRGRPVFDAQAMRDELLNVHKIYDPNDALSYGWAMAAHAFSLWATGAAQAAIAPKP